MFCLFCFTLNILQTEKILQLWSKESSTCVARGWNPILPEEEKERRCVKIKRSWHISSLSISLSLSLITRNIQMDDVYVCISWNFRSYYVRLRNIEHDPPSGVHGIKVIQDDSTRESAISYVRCTCTPGLLRRTGCELA